MPVGSTSQRSVQVSGFADNCLLTPLRRLYPLSVRQASALPPASSGFAVARDTLAVRLTLLLAECVEDFHLQVRAPCRAHNNKGPSDLEPLCFDVVPIAPPCGAWPSDRSSTGRPGPSEAVSPSQTGELS